MTVEQEPQIQSVDNDMGIFSTPAVTTTTEAPAKTIDDVFGGAFTSHVPAQPEEQQNDDGFGDFPAEEQKATTAPIASQEEAEDDDGFGDFGDFEEQAPAEVE